LPRAIPTISFAGYDATMKNNLIQLSASQLVSSPTPILDAEILLMYVLKISRAQLYTHDRQFTQEEQQQFQDLLERRIKGEPIAYLIGHKEFWSLGFVVTPAVLIPRPETELLVEKILSLFPAKTASLCITDLGTGSGAVALSLAVERPHWIIYAVDKSAAALRVAQENAKRFNISNVIFIESDWCKGLPTRQFDVIVSNPPYVEQQDKHLLQGDVRFEPKSALVAGEDGLQDIRQIIVQASQILKPRGLLLLEHSPEQVSAILQLLHQSGFEHVSVIKDLAGLERVTQGYYKAIAE
jgi:release factor glutamine methyltransferase